jgi:hypothetical protein
MGGAVVPLPSTPSWCGAQLKKGQGLYIYIKIVYIVNKFDEMIFIKNAISVVCKSNSDLYKRY